MIIQSKRVWIGSCFIPAQIEIVDDKIQRIYEYNHLPVDTDYQEARIIPGIIDIHIHGGYGVDTNDANQEQLRYLQQQLVKEGLVAFLPTTITQTEEVLTRALENVAEVEKDQAAGSEIIGIHFEGPYLDMEFKGAQPPECIVAPSIEQFDRFQKAANGLIKVITMACEHDPDFTLTRYLSANGVCVSQGHTGATFDQALLAIANGARGFTHVFNGMSRFGHRDLNVVGAAMRTRDVFGEIIIDGNHSDFNAVNIYLKSKGPDHGILISDAIIGKGEPIGSKFMFGNHPIQIKENGSAYLLDSPTNSLAGSTLRSNVGIYNIIEKVGLDWEYAIKAASTNPARYLRIDDQYGYIRANYKASLTILDDDYSVRATYVLGKCLYSK